MGSIPLGPTTEFNMKKFILPPLTFFLIYLLGVFVSVDFNISNWYMEIRFMVAIIGAAASIATLLIVTD